MVNVLPSKGEQILLFSKLWERPLRCPVLEAPSVLYYVSQVTTSTDELWCSTNLPTIHYSFDFPVLLEYPNLIPSSRSILRASEASDPAACWPWISRQKLWSAFIA